MFILLWFAFQNHKMTVCHTEHWWLNGSSPKLPLFWQSLVGLVINSGYSYLMSGFPPQTWTRIKDLLMKTEWGEFLNRSLGSQWFCWLIKCLCRIICLKQVVGKSIMLGQVAPWVESRVFHIDWRKQLLLMLKWSLVYAQQLTGSYCWNPDHGLKLTRLV